MRRLYLFIIAVGIAFAMAGQEQQQRVGLVLSGGGAKGIAEIGAIQAFEENDIPIDYVTGTSMGAIVGGLYAAGYSPQEMLELIESKMFLDASTGTIDPKYYYLFFTPEKRPSVLNISFGLDPMHKNKILPSSLISPMPMNFAFMTIFSGQTAQCGGDFDKLFVPLRTVASDMTHKEKHVFRSGQLDNAVRASMSFPIVFKPIIVDGSILYDGGIYDNFPFEVMKQDFNPDVMIGVDIHSTDTIKGFPDILQQMDILVIRNTNDYDLPEDYGIKLRINLNKFGLLDFPKAQEIYEIGYRHALEMVDSIKGRIHARRPAAEVARRRAEFRANSPAVVFDSVEVTGAGTAENNYIKFLFTPEKTDTFDIDAAQKSYMKALSSGMFRDLEPQARYNPETGRFALDLEADVKDNYDVGIGGYISSSVNSMLFLSLGYHSLSFRTIDASLNGWIGQSYMAAEFNTRAILRQRQNSSLGFQAVIWRQKFHESDKLFYEDEAPAFITNLETFYRLKYSIATGHRSVFDAGVTYGYLLDRFYNNDASLLGSSAERNKTSQHIGQLMLSWERNTLNDNLLPTSGSRIAILGQGVIEHFKYNPAESMLRSIEPEISESQKWLQIEINWRDYFNLSKHWSLGYEMTALASTRPLIDNYNAAIVNAPAFNPTPSSYNIFNPELRANSFATIGIVPIYKMNDRFEIRGNFHGFMPLRPIMQSNNDFRAAYGDWCSRAAFFGELAGTLKLPFGNLTVYGSYQTSPGDKWGIGLSFGYFILAPRMLRL